MKGNFIQLFVIFSFLTLSFFAVSQRERSLPELKVWKAGPYFGVQRGAYWVGEAGGEFQWKTIKLRKSMTQGIHTGANYNFSQNVLGYDLGYWIKPSRIGFTYGTNLIMRTDFTTTRGGIAPFIGYKIYGFHIQTGYQFFKNSQSFDGVNTFFLSLRFVIVNHRSTKVKK